MGNILGSIEFIIDNLASGPIKWIAQFAWWFYAKLIPFVLQYIGIPMFLLGIILAVSFAGGTVLFIIVFFLVMYYFIKGTIFTSVAKTFK
jgi:hypothetical protein